MRSLFIAGLRMLIILELIRSFITIVYYGYLQISSQFGDFQSAMNIILPSVMSAIVYVIVFSKAGWLADKSKISPNDTSPLRVDAKTIVASGLILFGVYGIVNQFLVSANYFIEMFSESTWSPSSMDGSGGTYWASAYTVISLLVYFYCIVGARRIAEMTTRGLVKESESEKD